MMKYITEIDLIFDVIDADNPDFNDSLPNSLKFFETLHDLFFNLSEESSGVK